MTAVLPLMASRCGQIVVLKAQAEGDCINLAKNVFQLHGAAADGLVVFRKKLSRPQFAKFTAPQPACLVAMDSGSGVHQLVGFQKLLRRLRRQTTLIPYKISACKHETV
jgi:hypothetical protein